MLKRCAPDYLKRRSEYQKERMRDGRHIVFSHYGYECTWCGDTTTKEVLQLDHVNNDGHQQRVQRSAEGIVKKFHAAKNDNYYRTIIKQGFPATYQVLCAVCNFYKGMANHFGELPPDRKDLFRKVSIDCYPLSVYAKKPTLLKKRSA